MWGGMNAGSSHMRLVCAVCPGRRHPGEEQEEAVGGGIPVTPGDLPDGVQPPPGFRTQTFEISQEVSDRQGEGDQGPDPTEEEQDQARIQADLTAIEGIRRAEVRQPTSCSDTGFTATPIPFAHRQLYAGIFFLLLLGCATPPT